MKNYHKEEIENVFAEFDTSSEGLDDRKAAKRLAEYGPNALKEEKKDSILKILLRQLKSLVILILFGAAIISAILTHFLETVIIMVIIIFLMLLGFFMEWKAVKDLEAIVKLTPKECVVRRKGNNHRINTSDVVPGDILVLTRGISIPADARIIESTALQIDESSLTGESTGVQKNPATIRDTVNLSERSNMIYAGTHVINGHGLAVVVRTGESTEIGKIGVLMKDIKSIKTPLQVRLDTLTKQISFVALIAASLSFAAGLIHGNDFGTMLVFSLAIMVSGIPESLPTVIAVTLAVGIKKMARENAIVKRFPAVETLGTCSVICTDKTGTLTQNKMLIQYIFTSDTELHVTGDGYEPKGLFLKKNEVIDPKKHKTVSKALEIGILCNNSDLKENHEGWIADGEPVECALMVLAKKAGFEKHQFSKRFKKKTEHPFDPDRKMMTTVHTYRGKNLVHSKGLPDNIIVKAKYYLHEGEVMRMNESARKRFQDKTKSYSEKGLSVLALAYKEHSGSHEIEKVEKELIMVGLVAIRDPPHPNAKEAVTKCKEAGIKVIMITGDSELTAKAIGKELGIYTEEDNILTGNELDKIVDEKEEKEFMKIIDSITVYARTTPKHKLLIVRCLQERGHIVAMTGDGVNDAPALKKADIGVAMGKGGTEVAKSAAEMILKDDNFATIVKAVETGRTIYENIRKFIYYLLSTCMSELLLISLAVMIGLNLPLTALMILFVNLVTGEFPALGLAVEKPHKDIMRMKPRDPKEGILSDFLITRIVGTIPIIALGTIALYIWEMQTSASHARSQTIVFATIIFFELFLALSAKSWNDNVLNKNIFDNKYVILGIVSAFICTLFVIYTAPMQKIFGTVALSPMDWLLIVGVTSSILIFLEMKKFFLRIEMKEREKLILHPTRG